MEKQHIGIELRAVSNALRRCAEAGFRSHNIDTVTGSNAWIIAYLHKNCDKPIYQKDIEKEFGITRSTASRALILMEKKGMIEREGVSHDSRLKRLKLTPKAVLISEQMKKHGLEIEARLTEGFSQQELEALRDYLARIKSNLGCLAEHPD